VRASTGAAGVSSARTARSGNPSRTHSNAAAAAARLNALREP
jgi:hypothetical protein